MDRAGGEVYYPSAKMEKRYSGPSIARLIGGNNNVGYSSQFQNAPFRPISALVGNFNPRNTPSIPAVEISDPP
jgi:hypothetical protein